MESGIEFDRGRHYRARVGVIVPPDDRLLESDLTALAPDGVGFHYGRPAPMDPAVRAPSLRAGAGLDAVATGAAGLDGGDLDVIAYGGGPTTMLAGEEQVMAALTLGAPAAEPTTVMTAVVAAFDVLGVERVAIASPYGAAMNRLERRYLDRRGIETVRIVGLGLSDSATMGRVAPDYLRRFATVVDQPEAEAVLVTGTAIRAMEVADQIERATGKPCVTAVQALLWHALRLAGVDDPVGGLGRLLVSH